MNWLLKLIRFSRLDLAQWDRAEITIEPERLRVDPTYTVAVSEALMPQLHELIDLGETADYYHRETRRMRELKEILDAHAARARALIQARRRDFNP